jgi:hypothetical protein
MRRNPKLQVRKHHFLLLEVVIAIILIALCIIPLISPHTFILTEQKKFIHKVELDHLVNLTFADIVERMYRNEIPWSRIVGGDIFEIDEFDLQRMGYDRRLPFTGAYSFKVEHEKPTEESPKKLYLLSLRLSFVPLEGGRQSPVDKGKSALNYYYEIFAVRDLAGGEAPSPSQEEAEPPQQEEEAL